MYRVLCVSIDQMDDGVYQALYDRASSRRRQRADSCIRRDDRLRCIISEALLAFALGTREISLGENAYGKPFLAGREDLHFNLSHAGSWVVLALGSAPVGIDVAPLSAAKHPHALARRHFTKAEQAFVLEEDTDTLPERFFRIWTAKESYLKFLGTGLTGPLDSFDVLNMESPRFSSRILEGHCLTLCAGDPRFALEILSPDVLLK